MKHEDWIDEITNAFSLRDEDKHDKAISKLKSLLRLLHQQIDAWHYSETLGIIAQIYGEAGNEDEEIKYHLKRARYNKTYALYLGQAAANSLGLAALRCFQIGKTRMGVTLARDALHLFGYYIDPSPTLEKVATALRAYYEKRANDKIKRTKKRR